MNKSKIIAASGLATIMSASVAMADGVSVNGYMEGWFTTGDNTTGMSNSVFSSSVYVAYSSTLDNGMGLSAGFTLTPGSTSTGFAVDTGMGTLRTGSGYQMNSAADGMDSMPANANAQYSALKTGFGGYNDGDNNSGEGIKYTSPSINGWTVAVSMGEDTANTDSAAGTRNTSIAAKGSLMGLSLAAGAVDDSDGSDDNFMTVGYSVAGVSMGYGVYDDDAGSESTIIGLNTSMAGLSLGYTFEDLDASTDKDVSVYSVGKDLGGMNVTVQYTDQDNGGAASNAQSWNFIYSVGF